MKADNFDLQAYFDRIGYAGGAGGDLATVAEVMRRQLYSVPFENLDVQAGKAISLEPADIVDKIVHRRRGGYCYEVNGLLAMALEAMGVSYRFVGCRPMTYPARRPRTHMALLVPLEGREWLCDTGFGSYGIRAPMALDAVGEEIRQGFDSYLLERAGEQEYILKAKVEGEWADQYAFDLWPHEWVDFMPANWLNSTHPDTLFVKHLIVMRQTPEGRMVLFNGKLKTYHQGQVATRRVPQEEVAGILRDTFGLAGEG